MQLIRNYWPIIANVLSCFDINWLTCQSKTFIYPRVTFVTPKELRIFNCESDVDSGKTFRIFFALSTVFLWRQKQNQRRKICFGFVICSRSRIFKFAWVHNKELPQNHNLFPRSYEGPELCIFCSHFMCNALVAGLFVFVLFCFFERAVLLLLLVLRCTKELENWSSLLLFSKTFRFSGKMYDL